MLRASPDKIVARRDDYAYVPTLEELIDACGDDFDALFGPHSSLGKREGQQLNGVWRADATNRTGLLALNASEALARLCLSLNSK